MAQEAQDRYQHAVHAAFDTWQTESTWRSVVFAASQPLDFMACHSLEGFVSHPVIFKHLSTQCYDLYTDVYYMYMVLLLCTLKCRSITFRTDLQRLVLLNEAFVSINIIYDHIYVVVYSVIIFSIVNEIFIIYLILNVLYHTLFMYICIFFLIPPKPEPTYSSSLGCLHFNTLNFMPRWV